MSISHKLSSNLSKNKQLFQELLPIGKSFDIITRDITLGSTPCYFLAINGMCDLQIIQWLFAEVFVSLLDGLVSLINRHK